MTTFKPPDTYMLREALLAVPNQFLLIKLRTSIPGSHHKAENDFHLFVSRMVLHELAKLQAD